MKNTIKKKRVFSLTAAFAIALTAVMVFGLVTCDSTPTGRPAVGSREYEARQRGAQERLANAQAELDAIVGAEISEAEAAAWEAEAEAYFAALEAGKTEDEAAAEGERAAVAAVVATGQSQTQAAATVAEQRQQREQRRQRTAELEAEVQEARTELEVIAAAVSASAQSGIAAAGPDPALANESAPGSVITIYLYERKPLEQAAYDARVAEGNVNTSQANNPADKIYQAVRNDKTGDPAQAAYDARVAEGNVNTGQANNPAERIRQAVNAAKNAPPSGPGIAMEMVWIPSKTRDDGSVQVEGFYAAKYDVTMEQWKTYSGVGYGSTGGFFRNSTVPNTPVTGIDWVDAVNYCNWMSGRANLSPVYKPHESYYDPYERNPGADGFRVMTNAERNYLRSVENVEEPPFEHFSIVPVISNLGISRVFFRGRGQGWGKLNNEWVWEAVSNYDDTGGRSISFGIDFQFRRLRLYRSDPGRAVTPVADLKAGMVAKGAAVTLTAGTAGSEIWYTTNGSNPSKNGSGSTRYTGPITVTSAVTIKAVAVKDGLKDSYRLLAAYTILPEPEMVRIPAGTFTMGSPVNEENRNDNETQHQVRLTQGFYMGKFQVTQEQYRAVMGNLPGLPVVGRQPYSRDHFHPEGYWIRGWRDYGIGNNFPIYDVSWYDALVFCNRLSILEGKSPAYRINGSTNPDNWGPVPTSSDPSARDIWDAVTIVAGSTGYRLPTEAQWEYACRAGTTTAFYFGAETIREAVIKYRGLQNWGNFGPYPFGIQAANNILYGGKTEEVGGYSPNPWGLYDMYGNVYEWCWDWYALYPSGAQTDPTGPAVRPPQAEGGRTNNSVAFGGSRILRSSSWRFVPGPYDAGRMRSAFRDTNYPFYRDTTTGFRLVRPL